MSDNKFTKLTVQKEYMISSHGITWRLIHRHKGKEIDPKLAWSALIRWPDGEEELVYLRPSIPMNKQNYFSIVFRSYKDGTDKYHRLHNVDIAWIKNK